MRKKFLPLLISVLSLHFTSVFAGDVITEDSTTDPALPRAIVDGDLIVEDIDGSNEAAPGLYVQGLTDLRGGLMLEGSEVIPLYVQGGATKSANTNGKIMLGQQQVFGSGWGLTVALIDRSTGALLSSEHYTLWGLESEYEKLAQDLAALDDGSVIVAIASNAGWSIGWGELEQNLLKQLQRMGASTQINHHFFSGGDIRKSPPYYKNYALVGIPGIGAGNGIEVLNEDAPKRFSFPATIKTAEVSTLLIKAGSEGKYTPVGLANSAILNDAGDAVLQRLAIGKRKPHVELDVVGDAKISGNLTVEGSIAGNLAVAQGSLLSGGLATDGDGDSGIYSPAEDTVSIATAGVERLSIDDSGAVQIAGSVRAEDLVLTQGSGITFADGSRMTKAPAKVVYINEGDDITAILSSEEENVWYQIGPGTFTLTANVSARNGCRYSGAGKNLTILQGAAIKMSCSIYDASCYSETIDIVVESFTAFGDRWLTGKSSGTVVIRDCAFYGEDVGADRKTYWIYDSGFFGDRAFSHMEWGVSLTVNAYNSIFESSDSFGVGQYITCNLKAYNCIFSGQGVGGRANGMMTPIKVEAYNCDFNVSNSFGGSQMGVDFTAHNSTIDGSNNFDSEGFSTPPTVNLYNCTINGVSTNKTAGSSIIDAPSVGIGTDTPAANTKLDVAGNTNIAGDLTVNGGVTLKRQGDIFMGQFGVGEDQGL